MMCDELCALRRKALAHTVREASCIGQPHRCIEDEELEIIPENIQWFDVGVFVSEVDVTACTGGLRTLQLRPVTYRPPLFCKP